MSKFFNESLSIKTCALTFALEAAKQIVLTVLKNRWEKDLLRKTQYSVLPLQQVIENGNPHLFIVYFIHFFCFYVYQSQQYPQAIREHFRRVRKIVVYLSFFFKEITHQFIVCQGWSWAPADLLDCGVSLWTTRISTHIAGSDVPWRLCGLVWLGGPRLVPDQESDGTRSFNVEI